MVEDNENGPPTFESEGYDREDWIPVFEPIEEQDELDHYLGGPTDTYEEVLFKKENDTGAEVIYRMSGGDGGLWLEYMPGWRSDNGVMLYGTIEFGGDFQNEHVVEAYDEIMKSHATAYIMPRVAEEQLGTISVPEGFHEEELYETAQAVVGIIKDAQRLQEELRQTTEDFAPS